MVTNFLHYEVLGPRATLDAWLAALQDAGVCHLADAMRDQEGEPRIGRPTLRAEEVHADLVRSEAARALRAVERVLPASSAADRAQPRPAWTLGPGGLGEREVLLLKDESRSIAAGIRAALERVRLEEEKVERLDGLGAALGELVGEDSAAWPHVLLLPSGSRRARVRRLERRARRAGFEVRRARGESTEALVLRGVPSPSDAVDDLVTVSGARALDLPEDLRELPRGEVRARLAERQAAARREAGDARAALTARIRELGPRGRLLLDSLEDAEGRTAARRHLASTEHLVAARVYVRPEDEQELREGLRAAHGDTVVMRPLAEVEDEPSLPRRIAALPLSALGGLRPRSFADLPLATVLAVLTPLAVGLAWADVAGGLLLLLAGALLGGGAGVDSPRRDTALMAQAGGLVALVLGVLTGRAFGDAGAAWFGTGWGLLPTLPQPAAALPVWLQPFTAVLVVLGAFAALVGLWGLLLTLHAWRTGRGARGRGSLVTVLHCAAVAGLAAAAWNAGGSPSWIWLVAPVAALAVLLLSGPAAFLSRLCLDLVGVLRLVAVAGGALVVFQVVLRSWIEPAPIGLVLGPLALLVAALAVVADPAHLAMGVPYDIALGGRRLRQPFQPFARRSRPGEDD